MAKMAAPCQFAQQICWGRKRMKALLVAAGILVVLILPQSASSAPTGRHS
jgi:hypothetical protein